MSSDLDGTDAFSMALDRAIDEAAKNRDLERRNSMLQQDVEASRRETAKALSAMESFRVQRATVLKTLWEAAENFRQHSMTSIIGGSTADLLATRLDKALADTREHCDQPIF
jgi:hypothetical protein